MNRKERKRERFQSIYRAMEPLRTAKTNTIRSLASVGRKHKWLRYPILISLVAFVFVYNLFLYAFIRMKVQEKLARALATAMTVVLVVTSIDLTALAMNTKEEGFYKLSSVDEIGDSLVSVLMGTPIEELELPETISAYLDFYTLEEVVTDEEVEDPELEDPELEDPEVEDPDVENPEVEDPTVPNPEEPDLTVPNPEEPDPTVPNPEEPDPTVPNPEEPDPTVPNPEEPDPTVPNPEEPDPTVPNPEEPDPTVPNPEEPDPTVPNPEEPDPTLPDPVVTDPVVTDPVVEDPIVETPAPAPVSEDVVVETQTVELEPVNSELQTDVTIETLSLDAEVIAEESTVSGNDNETENSGTGVVTGEIILQEKYVNTIPAELPVTWLCEDYDGDTAGDYIFTAKLSENTYNDYIYFVEEDIELPSITVRVAEPHTFESIVEVDGIEIQMTAAAGVFPEGAVLSVNKITDEASMQKITESVQDAVDEEAKEIDDTGKVQTTIAFDIKVLDENGEEIQPNIPEGMNPETAVQVTFKQIVPQMALPEDEVSGDQIMEVYYVEDSMESATVMETAVEDDSLSFSPEHFSTYVCTCWKTSWKSISSWEALYKAVYNKTGAINARLKKNIYVDSMFLKWDSYCLYLDEGQTLNLDLYGNDLWSEDDHSCIVDLSYGSTLNLHNTKGNGWIRGDDYSYAVLVRKNSTFNMYGGSIYKSGGASEGIRVYDGGKVNIYGGRIYGFNYGIYAPYSDTVTINMNGEGYIDNCKYGIYLAGNNKTVDIKSGDITNSTYAGIYNSYANSSVSFTGGKITGKSGYRTYGIYNPSGGSLTIGGNVNFSNNSYGDIYIRGVQEASYTSGTTNLVKISQALTGSKVGIRTYYTPTEAAPVVVAANNTSKDKLYNSTNSSYGVYQPTGKTYLVTGPMSNSNVTVTIEKEGLYTPDEIDGKVAGKIAWGTEALSTEDISKVVKFNAEVSLTAMIEDVDNYDFAGWYIGDNTTPTSTELNYTFEAVGNVDVKAVFKKKTFKVTASVPASQETMGSASIGNTYTLGGQTYSGVPAENKYEIGSKLTLNIEAEYKDTINNTDRYYEFVQWSDGFVSDKMTWETNDNGYKINATRTVTVTESVNYVAQFKQPKPDPNAIGKLFSEVEQITAQLTGTTVKKVLLIPQNSTESMNTTENITATGGRILAVAGLPTGSGKLETSSDSSYVWSSFEPSTVVSGLMPNSNIYNIMKVNERATGFDTCPGGVMQYHDGTKAWYFWCSQGGIDGAGPYNAYVYSDEIDFNAGNIKAKLNSLKLTGDTVVDVNLDITVTDKNDSNKKYQLTNLIFEDAYFDYKNGDRTIQLNLGGVAFAYVLPEAVVGIYNETTQKVEAGTEYTSLSEALDEVTSGQTLYVVGPAVSQSTEDIEVEVGIKIRNYDGSMVEVVETTDANNNVIPSKVRVDNDGIIRLVQGTLVATPSDEVEKSTVTVDVKDSTVTSDAPITITTNNGGSITTNDTASNIVISPDGDPNHTVTYVGKDGGIPSGTEYGLSSGELTVEEKVVISEGTEYDLKVDLGGTDQVIKTESTNTGDTTISKGQDNNGNNTVVIESEKKNNSVTVGEGQNAQEFITSEDGTKLVLTQGNENVGLEEGSVSVPQGGQIQLPSGQVIENSSNGTGDRITVSADDEGNENVNIPSGSQATINGIDVSVPQVGEGEAENLPAKVTLNQNGNVEVSGKPGNQVTIGGQKYTIGDYDATIEVTPDNNGDGKPETVVTEGSIVLAPGQSITDSNGVTYTNPAGSSGNMQLTMTPGQNTSVEVAPGKSFTYKTENGTAGSYTNPSTSSDVSFSVSPGGNVSLDSEVSLAGPNNLSIETENGKVDIIVPAGNADEVVIDPVSGSVTINKDGDKVSLGKTEYEATQDGTVLVPNGDRVELTDGGVKLDRNEEVYANGVGITNSGSGQLGVKLGDDGKTTVTVPQGGGFTMSDDESDNTVSFTNPGGQADYTINERGELEVGAGKSLTFNQGGVSTTISPGTGGATVTPTEDGVQLSVPAGGNITIGGVTYTNNGTDEMIIVVDPTGKPVIKGGSASIPTGESIYLQDGTKVSNKGGGVTIDANGKATVADGSNVGFTTNGKESNYIAAGGPVELTINPETGIPVKTGGSGKTQLGAGSSLEVITDTKTGASTGEEGANETELDQEQKLTITNNSTDTSAAPTVDNAGNVTVPENGKVTIKAESVKSDGTITTTENTISVPSGSEAVTLDPQTDGSVDVLFGDNAGNEVPYSSGVIFNGKELTTHTPGTKLTVTETGASLEEGSIELDPDETISVNGTGFSNTGNADSKVNITKDTSTSPATTGVEVSPGGSFEMFVPGQKDTAVEFTNPDTANSADYSVDSEGNIKLEDGEGISFDFPGGAQGVTVSGAPGAEGEDSDDVSLKVTKDGVKITAQPDNDIKINDIVFKNTDTTGNEELVITVEPDGTPKLEEGSTVLPAGNSMKLPGGETITITGGNASVDSNGNITIPSGNTEDITLTIKTPDGKTHKYVVPAGSTEDVRLNCDPDSNTNVPVLENGTTQLGGGSKVTTNNGKTTIQATDGNQVTVDEEGNFELQPGSGVKVDSDITDNGETIDALYQITTPVSNTGKVTAAPDNNGGYDISVEKGNDTVKVTGVVGGDTFTTEFTTTEDNTKLSVSDDGTTLEQGGVVLDGGTRPNESINVNGTGITNTGNSAISVNKNTSSGTPVTNLNVGAGGSFELFDPENPDSAVKFTNPGTTAADYTINADGSIELDNGSDISFVTSKNLPITLEGSNNVGVNVTEDGVEVTVPSGETVTVNGKTYKSTGSEPLKMVIDNSGNKVITSGTTTVPSGESVYVKDTNGNLTEIKKDAATSSQNDDITVSANGNVGAKAGDEIIIGDGKYSSKDSTGEFDLKLNPATGKVTLTDGNKLGITDGNITIDDDTNGDVSVSTTGNKEVLIEKAEGAVKPTITIPAGGNATIDDGNDGSGVEILVPGTTVDGKDINMDGNGDLTVELAPGEQITIAGVIYTADENQAGNTTLTIDGATGSLKSSTGGNVETEIDPDGFNRPNYSYDVPSGGTVIIDGVEYEAPSGGMTIIGNPDGKPIIKVNQAGQSVTIGGKEYTAGSDNTKFIVNSEGNVTLVGDGSSIIVNAGDTMYVDGNKIVASGSGSATITKESDGSNSLTTNGNVQTDVTLGNNTPLNLAGTTATVNGSTYRAPSDGMTLTPNGAGKKPTVTVNKSDTTVQIDGVGYTAGNDKTQFIVNSPNNVTLVDNNNNNANSSLVVKNPREMVIDGNTIKATGATTGGYTITKNETGNDISIKNGTKLDITMGNAGSPIKVAENVIYEDRPTPGTSTTITPSKAGTQIVLDKTSTDGDGNYVTELKPAGTTTITPKVDEDGNITGFETTRPDPKPVTPPSSGDSGSSGSSSSTVNKPVEEVPEEELEEELEESDEEAEDEALEEDDENASEDSENDTSEDADGTTGDSSEPSSNGTIAGDGDTAGDAEEEDIYREPQSITIESLEEAVDVEITGNTQVTYGGGSIVIKAEGKGNIVSDLDTVLKACLNDKEIKKVNKGENVEIRFSVKVVKQEVITEDEKAQIVEAYQQFAEVISGFEIADTYDIVIERRMGDSDWEEIHELNTEIELVVDIPEEIRKDGRTYYLMRNHEGVCTLLEDIDTDAYTITVLTGHFSTYVISYTDAEVSDVDIEALNQSVMLSTSQGNNALLWILVIILAMAAAFGVWYYGKKRKEQ